MDTKHVMVTTLTFHGQVTERDCHRSCDHLTRDGPFPIGGPLDPSLYLYRFPRYSPKHHVLIDTMLNRRCACAISCDMYSLCEI